MTKNLLAQITNPALGDTLQTYNNDGAGFVSQLISVGITLMFIAGFVIFVFMFITGGVQWIMSSGDKAAVEGARGRIMHAILGLFVLFFIFAFIKLVEGLFDISLVNITIPTLQTAG